MEKQTQNRKILAHLKSKPITPLEALNRYGCFRLGARIYELRNRGHNIKTEMVEVRGKKLAKYRLVKD